MGLDFRGQLIVFDVFGRSPRRTLLASVSGDMLAVGCREKREGKRREQDKTTDLWSKQANQKEWIEYFTTNGVILYI